MGRAGRDEALSLGWKALSLDWLAREGKRVLRPKRCTAGPTAQALNPRLCYLCMACLGNGRRSCAREEL